MIPKVLLFSIVDFSDSGNGGGLFSANLLTTLADVQGVNFIVVSIGPETARQRNRELVEALGMRHEFIAFRERPIAGDLSKVATILKEKVLFQWEVEARRQAHVDLLALDLVESFKPDLVLVNYLYTALFLPSVLARTGTRYAVVTLNDESTFQRLLKTHGGPLGTSPVRRVARWLYRHFNGIANARASAFERRIYAESSGVAALTERDLPRVPETVERIVLPPLFRPREPQWHYQRTLHAFFVGNIAYYPNFLAVEWLCRHLAPELLRLDARMGLRIIGASAEQVPKTWLCENVKFLGLSNKAGVVQEMITADLFLAPIENPFGAKLKLAECISHGQPFLATREAMTGLPFSSEARAIELSRPVEAAQAVRDLLGDPEELVRLSGFAAGQMALARDSQVEAWQGFIDRCITSYAMP